MMSTTATTPTTNQAVKAFYRVYRPQTFQAVVGQEFITKTLANQIQTQKIGHAYLFCGTRGTGKTSVAKIFANAVNCENFHGEACGKCDWCTSPNKNMDVIEIDAASNNGVDAVRELVESVKYPPMVGHHKVYIIDEVHMFSSAAFNALLKTLEEPPAHVIFILATTEPQKLLPTVQSRCLRFNFQNVTTSAIAQVLTQIFAKEQLVAEPAAVTAIAREGRGSMRDALSFADTVAAYCGQQPITAATVNKILGGADSATYQQLVTQIVANDPAGIRATLNQIFEHAADSERILSGVIQAVKATYIADPTPKLANALKIFANLEPTWKFTTDPQSHLETAALLAGAEVLGNR